MTTASTWAPTNHTTMYRKPIITLSGGGDSVTLDGVGTGMTLKPGSTGLGLPPVELSTVGLEAGGSLIRHRREDHREIFLPIDVHHGADPRLEYAHLEETRQRLERICSGEVEITVETARGVRSTLGWYKDGLDGRFSKDDVNLVRMNLGLTFLCPDPMFYGRTRAHTLQVAEPRKPFLSEPVGGSRLASPFFPIILSSAMVEGAHDLLVQGDAEAYGVARIVGPGADVTITNETTGRSLSIAGEITDPITVSSRPGRYDVYTEHGDVWERVTGEPDVLHLAPGQNLIRISMVDSAQGSTVSIAYQERWRSAH